MSQAILKSIICFRNTNEAVLSTLIDDDGIIWGTDKESSLFLSEDLSSRLVSPTTASSNYIAGNRDIPCRASGEDMDGNYRRSSHIGLYFYEINK